MSGSASTERTSSTRFRFHQRDYEWFRTIDDLFALVAGALEREAVVRVSYEPELGYPARIYIDYVQDLVGEEVELRVLELRKSD